MVDMAVRPSGLQGYLMTAKRFRRSEGEWAATLFGPMEFAMTAPAVADVVGGCALYCRVPMRSIWRRSPNWCWPVMGFRSRLGGDGHRACRGSGQGSTLKTPALAPSPAEVVTLTGPVTVPSPARTRSWVVEAAKTSARSPPTVTMASRADANPAPTIVNTVPGQPSPGANELTRGLAGEVKRGSRRPPRLGSYC
jgi:hypothetical protein